MKHLITYLDVALAYALMVHYNMRVISKEMHRRQCLQDRNTWYAV